MYIEDAGFHFSNALVHRVGLPACFGLGAAVSLSGLFILALRRKPRLGWLLLGAGMTVAWLGLVAISECRTETVLNPVMTARSRTFADPARAAAQFGILAVPATCLLVKLARDRWIYLRRRSQLSTYLRTATKSYYAGDFDRAIAEYSVAIRIDPARLECYVRRGMAWMAKGRYDRAIADFDRTIKLDPDHGAAHLHRGVVLAARGHHLAAIGEYEKALQLDSTDAAPLLYRGLSLARIGESARAADDFRRVLHLTNHSDFTEPARFHLTLLKSEPSLAVEGTSNILLANAPSADGPHRPGFPGRLAAVTR
jgi:tetratricopeptide (TPR) repeat protein